MLSPQVKVILSECYPTLHSSTDDDHRVMLKPMQGHSGCWSDYVNASYVNVGWAMDRVQQLWEIVSLLFRDT